MTNHNTYAETFRAARLKAGLTQQDVAQRTGLNRAYVSQIETGARTPALDTARRLNQILDIPQAAYANSVLAAIAEESGLTFRELIEDAVKAFDGEPSEHWTVFEPEQANAAAQRPSTTD
jgi:transcriptional regulator with XRE-family HTH domain